MSDKVWLSQHHFYVKHGQTIHLIFLMIKLTGSNPTSSFPFLSFDLIPHMHLMILIILISVYSAIHHHFVFRLHMPGLTADNRIITFQF